MTREELNDLRKDIIGFQLEDLEAKFKMFGEYLGTFVLIFFNKGFNGNFLNELRLIHSEYQSILSEEIRLFGEILRKASKMDLDAIDMFILKINELNDRTIDYYYQLLDDIENDSERDYCNNYRRLPKDFNTLIEFYDFRTEVVGLTLSFDDIKKFLDYEDEFWDYLKTRCKFVDEPYIDEEEKRDFYGTWYELDENNNLSKLRVCIPKIVDLNTAIIAIREIVLVHSLYSKDLDFSSNLVSNVRGIESDFKDKYIPKKNKRLFK